jgi:hypothetical protein
LPKHVHIGNFEVEHDFPTVGTIMRLNARQIHQEAVGKKTIFAAEDITRFKAGKRAKEYPLHVADMKMPLSWRFLIAA